MFRFIIIGLFVFPITLLGQVDSSITSPLFSYNISLHQAFVLVHSEEIRPIEDAYPVGLQIDFNWQQRDKSTFDKCHCFPKLGGSIQLWNFDNKEILGHGMNTYFFIEPEYGASKFVSFSFRGGFGAAFLTKPHHPEDNPNNQSYSTKIAFSLIVATKASIKLSTRNKLDVSAYYNHISNGGVKQPNKGINYPSISLGLSHNVDDLKFNKFNYRSWNRDERLKRLDLTPFLSWKQVELGNHVLAPGFESKYSYQVASLSALTIGLEYFEDNFAKYQFEKNNEVGEWRKLSSAVGHEFLLGRILFSQQLGFYIFNPDWQGDPFYQRYGIVYRFTDLFALGLNVKAHRQVADLVDYRLVFSL